VVALAAWRPGLESQACGVFKKVSRFFFLQQTSKNRLYNLGFPHTMLMMNQMKQVIATTIRAKIQKMSSKAFFIG